MASTNFVNGTVVQPEWLNDVNVLTYSYYLRGEGSPEGVVSAGVGTLYINSLGGATTTLYVKETGTGNTGWVAK